MYITVTTCINGKFTAIITLCETKSSYKLLVKLTHSSGYYSVSCTCTWAGVVDFAFIKSFVWLLDNTIHEDTQAKDVQNQTLHVKKCYHCPSVIHIALYPLSEFHTKQM